MAEAADAGQSLSGAPATVPADERRYDLLTREGSALSHLHMDRTGIALSDDGLAWHSGEDQHSGRLADIASIRLQFGQVQGAGNLCTCKITFGDGPVLSVYSAGTWGDKPEVRASAYRDFVRDLHRRLPAPDRARIGFLAGDTEGRHIFGTVTLAVASLFFIVTPLVLLAMFRELNMLGIAAFGIALVVPLYHVLGRNKPRTYDPARIPDDLLP